MPSTTASTQLNTVRFGELLRAMRGPISQTELADRTGIPQYLISNLERGEVDKPAFEFVARICKELGYSLDMVAAAAQLAPVDSQEWDSDYLTIEMSKIMRIIRGMAMEMNTNEQLEFAARLEISIESQRRAQDRMQLDNQQQDVLPRFMRRREEKR